MRFAALCIQGDLILRVLALASQKGGSGKTTLSGHLAVQAQRLVREAIAAGKEGFWSFWIRPGFRTNIANCTQQ